jgi:CysZ protein
VVITAIALLAMTWFAFDLRDELVALLWTAPDGEGVGAAAARGLHTVLELLAAVLLIVVGVVAVALVSSLIAAPFNDALSEAIESEYAGTPGAPLRLNVLLRDAVRSVGLQLLKLAAYAAIMVPAFLVSLLLPGIGGLLYAALGFVVTSLFLALDYVDFAAARRGLGARERFRDALGRWPAMLGLGAAIWLLLFVPFLNLLFMPAAVAAGTLLFVDAHRAAGAASGP